MRDQMTANEAIQMMERCKSEIQLLRAQVAHLQPKADAYDNLATVLHLLPKRSVGASEDWVWVLDKRIRELQVASTPAPTLTEQKP